MNSFNFNSQICTSREQSERLLSLGLKKETADVIFYLKETIQIKDSFGLQIYDEDSRCTKTEVPAWSLYRLIEMMAKEVQYNGWYYYFIINIGENMIGYFPPSFGARKTPLEYFCDGDSIYDGCIACIEWLIEEEYFNKEYLEQ